MSKSPPRRQRLQVQELEPRLLYSAEAAAWLGGGASALQDAVAWPSYSVPAPAPLVLMQTEQQHSVSREFIFIDSRVPDAAQLADSLMQQRSTARSFDIVLLLPDEDGVAKIAQLLAQERDLAAIHIISHGSEGMVQLGAAWLNPAALQAQAEALQAWGEALAPQGDLLLYGCDVAAGAQGQGLLQQLAAITGADVAASRNATGLGQGGVDVELEARTGAIEAQGVIQPELAWSGTLALTPQGGETRVNTNTIGNQTTTLYGGGAVAMDSLGNYVVAWADTNSNVGDVFFQRYNAAGVAQGANVRANTNVASTQSDVVVAMDSAGNFVVVWTSRNQDGSGEGVYAQRYDASGVAQGVEFRVNTTVANNQMLPTVAMAPGGAFVVAWTDDFADSSAQGVFAQRYNAAGVAQGGQFQVNTVTADSQSYASAAMDGSGNFVITWEGAQTGNSDVYGQRYNAAGVAQGGEFRVNTTTANGQWNTAVAMDSSGNFVVVWEADTQDNDGSPGIYAQRFNASGVAQGGEFRVNTTVANGQTLPAVAMNATGGFVVTWQSGFQDGSSEGVYAQEFSAAGVAQGSELLINTTTANDQSTPSVAYRGIQAVVAWNGEGPGDAFGVFMQRLATSPPPGITVGAISGNTSEAGGMASFTVVLDSAPSANVTIPVSSSNLLEGSVWSNLLLFTPGNWNVAQSIDVEGANETIVDGDRAYSVVLGATSSLDAGYNGLDPADVAVINTDNDTQSTLTVSTTADTVDGATTSLYDLLANPGADGRISLREAITAANATANGIGGVDRLRFSIPDPLVAGAHTLTLNTDLPALTEGVLIDGSTEPDFRGMPVVMLDGNNSAGQGLSLRANNTTIRGLGIGGFTGRGVLIENGAANVLVAGNHLGVDATGLLARPNGAWGVDVISAGTNVLIGGSSVADRNVIGANGLGGIAVNNTQPVTITGNHIGVGADGFTPLGNGEGVFLFNYTVGTRIGGVAPGEGNLIAYNSGQGVQIVSSSGSVLGNRFVGNGGLGLDLNNNGTVEANDTGDADTGANGLQNYPVLTSVHSAGGDSTFTGTFNSAPNATYRLEFFGSPTADASAHGEGRDFLGATTVTTDGSGNAGFSALINGLSLVAGRVVSATATVDLGGGLYGATSEFAANVLATAQNSAPAELAVSASTRGGLQINAATMGDTALAAADANALFGGRSQFTVEWLYSSPGVSNGSDALLNYLAPGKTLELLVLRSGTSALTLAVAGQVLAVTDFDYSVLEDGATHGLALSWSNTTGAWAVSVDGVQRSSGTGLATGLTLAANGELHVGQQLSSIGGTYLDNRGWQATVHGLRVFDDVRSASEIASSWRSTVPNTEPGLLADWRFDQLTPTGVVPSAVNGNGLDVLNTGNPLHVADTPALALALPENSLTGTVVGQVQGLDADREAQIAQLLADDPSLSYSAATGKFYRAVAATSTWTAAQANATSSLLQGVAGQLITIRSAADQAVAQAMTLTLGHHVWLGATDLGVEGQWRWYAGSSAGDSFWLGASSGAAVNGQFTRWAQAEPNGGVGENRLTMYYSNGLWNDADGLDTSVRSIVEWDADAVLDALVPLTYSITAQSVPGAFAVDADTGQLVVANGLLLNYEAQPAHSVTVQVSDGSSTVSRVLTVNLANLAEATTAPTGVASGLSLNEDGGNDAYLLRNDGGSLLGGATALTIEVAFTTLDATGVNFVSYRTPSDGGQEDDGLRLALRADGEWRLVVNGAGAAGLNLGLDDGSSRDGRLHHAAVTWDSASGAWTFHLDGRQVSAGSGYATGQAVRPGGTLVVGQEQDSINGGYTVPGSFAGALYDLRLWNHARTATEIALNAQQKFSLESLPVGLLANWQMNGLNGSNEVVDVVAGRNLTVAHASGPGFTASTPQPALAVKENTPNGTHVGYVMPVAPAVANDVVADGRFMLSSTIGFFSQGATVGGWTVAAGSVDLDPRTTPLGGRVVDLNGLAPGVLTQTLATVAGRQYQVVFRLSGNFDVDTLTKHLRVSADGQAHDFAVAHHAGWSPVNPLFDARSFTFTATAGSTVLAFAGLDAGAHGPLLADVQVLEVPTAVSTVLNADPTLRFNAATNKFYRAVAAPADWNAAQAAAQAAMVNGVAGQLVTIGSAYENQWVRERGQELNAGWGLWLGATDAAVEGTWRWARGAGLGSTFWIGGSGGAAQPGQYANWQVNEPNDLGNEDVAYLELNNGGWNDTVAGQNLPYLIEWDATAVLGHYRFDLPLSAAGRFALNPESGEVTVANASLIDYEAAAGHNITVQANDAQAQGFAAVLPVAILNQGGEPAQVLPLATQNLNEDTVQVFSAANGNAITVGDTDGASDIPLQLTLSVGQGRLTLSQLTGLSVVAGANGSNTVTVQGLESALNAALNGLSYQPNLDFHGADALTVTTSLGAKLAGQYVFEGGTANDVSAGLAQNGSFVGNATTVIDGTRGSVLGLDGVGDAINIASDFGNPADLTLATWVNVDATQAQQADLIHIGYVGALQFDPAAGGRLIGTMHDGSQWLFHAASANLQGTGWHHVAVSWNDTASVMTLYLDGVALPSTSGAYVEAGSPFGATRLGGDWAGLRMLTGRMDDARLYTRALGAAEVAALAADQTAVTGNVALQVNPVNDAPVGHHDTLALTEDTRTTVAVLANDSDVEGDALIVSAASIDLDGDGFNDPLVLGGFSSWMVRDNSAQPIGELDFTANVFGFTPASNYLGAVPVLTYTVYDGNVGSAVATLSFSAIAPVNDAPTVIAPASVNVQPQQAVAPTITVADVDAGNAAVRLTLVTRDFTALTLPGTSGATLGVSSSTPGNEAWTIDGSLAQIQTELNAMTLRTAASFIGTSTVTLTFNDLGNSGSGGALQASTNLALVVDAANDAPVFAGFGGAVAYTEGAAPVVLASGASVFDAELTAQGHYAGATLLLVRNGGADAQDVFSDTGLLAPLVEGGSLVYGGTTIGTVATNSAGLLVLAFDASATQARVDGTLQAIAYAHAGDGPPASVVMNWTFNDGNAGAQGSGGALNANGAVTVNITGTNDAPVITSNGGGNSANLLATENTTTVTTVTATDPDLPAQTLTFSLSGGADMALFDIDANTGVLSFLVAPNYEVPQDFNTDNVYDVQVLVSDGSLSDAQDVVVTVTNANDAPQLNVPASYSATEQQSLALHGTGISVTDVDAGANPIRLVVSVASGELNAVAGGTGVVVSGSGTAAVTLTGSLAQLNDLLAGNAGAALTFLNPSDAPTASVLLNVQADDQGFSGPGGGQVANATASINMVAVNDAPTVLLSAAQSLNEDATLVLSSGNGNNIAINEPDAGLAPLRVTLTASSGTLTLAGTTGLTFLSGDGTADASMSFEGSNPDLFAALNGLAFTPAANMVGAVTLTVTANDLGNSGTGGALSDTQVLALTVSPVNDAPVISFGEGAKVYNEGGAALVIDALATASDIDSPDFAGGTLLVDITVNAWADDVIEVRHQGMGAGQVGLSGGDVYFGGVLIGSFTGSGTSLFVAFNGSADGTAVEAVMRNITFRSGEDMSTLTRTVRFVLGDGDGDVSAAITKQIAPLADNRLWVTTTADTADGDTSSLTALLADRGADGFISLREALVATNNSVSSGAPDVIAFNIAAPLVGGVHSLVLSSALPSITDALLIDGGTEPDYAGRPVVVLEGGAAGAGVNGLVLAAGSSGSRVSSLQLQNFTGDGIRVLAGSNGNTLLGNRVFGNGGLGIDLGGDGVTPNDAGDADNGANDLQNHPVLNSANSTGGDTTVVGTFNSTANTTFRIVYFSSPVGDGSGHGEGQWWLGAVNVTTDGSGNANLITTLVGVSVAPGHAVSATATVDLGGGNFGSTSEFAANVLATAAAPGVLVSPASGPTTEGGGNATFTVALTAAPTANVTIALNSSNTAEGNVLPASLTFTPFNWNVAQTVTATGVDDFVNDGDVAYLIVTGSATSADTRFNGLTVADVALVNEDDDSAGVIVSPMSGHTTEAGGMASFMLVLGSQPTAEVTVALSSSNLAEGSLSVSSVTFTPANWNTVQMVTVTGVNDFVDDGDVAYQLITAPASSLDVNYNGVNAPDVAAVNRDDDVAGINVSALSGNTTEAGGAATFTVVLNSQPTADVTVALNSSNLAEGSLSVSSVTFTPANWNIVQTVTVTGVNDSVDDGDVAYQLITAPANSLDAAYNGFDAADVAAVNQDDDAAGITVSALSGQTTEAGGTATFAVVLNSQPTADVTVALNSSNLAEGGLSVSSVTFTPANWNTAQAVTATGVDDAVADGDIAYQLVTAPASSLDANYNGFDAADVAAVNQDDDAAAITVSALSGQTSEAGGTATFTVLLNSQPAADVTVALSSSNLAEGSLSVSSVTFTPANWNTVQTVTVTGVNDAVDDGDQAYQVITSAAASADPSYDGMAVADAAALNRDDDTAGLNLSLATGPTTEAGGSASFSVALSTRPLADVVIQLDTLNPGEGVLSRSLLTFTPANWNQAQSVGVVGVDDAVADGATAFAVRASVAASADGLYSGLSPANVAFINQDDDVAGVWVGAISGHTTESGGSASFQVRLTSQPTAEVVIAVNSSDAQQGTLAVANLRFDASNWNLPQTVVVTGVSDGLANGDTLFQVVLAPAVSLDANYNGADAADVVVLNRDNTAPRWLGPVSFDVAENSTAVAIVQAQDDDLPANALQFSLAGGADAAWFQIDPQTGTLRFVNAPDHELPGDANRDNLYDLQVQVSDGLLLAVQPVQVRVLDINDQAPRIHSDGAQDTATLGRDENGTSVTQVTASDADVTSALSFQIVGGADAARFQIDTQTGWLSFLAAPDFEQPADTAGRNRFEVIVQASDGAFSDTQAITVVLADLNDNTPMVANLPNLSASENTLDVVTLTATDGDAGTVFTYRIAGGADAAAFEVDARTGALRFVAPRDFEAQDDANGDGVFEVWVAASDGPREGQRPLQIRLLDANDAPTAATLNGTLNEGDPLRLNVLAAATDPDAGQPGLLDAGAVRIEQAPAHGRLQLQPDGSVVYTHDGSETTEDSFRYSVADAVGLRSPVAQVSLRIAPVNDAPQLQAMSVSLRSGQTVALDPAQFQIQDPDTPRAQWVFEVVQMAHARFEQVSRPGLAISQFSQLDADAGRVRLVSTNALEAPVITLRASDGALASAPVAVTVQFAVQIEPEVPVIQTPNRPAPPTPEPTPDALPQDNPAPAPAPAAVSDRERLSRSDKAVVPALSVDVDDASVPQGLAGLGRASVATEVANEAGGSSVLVASDDSASAAVPVRSLRENVTVGFDLLQPLSLDAFLSSMSLPLQVQEVEARGPGGLGRLGARDVQASQQALNKEEKTGEFKFSTQEAVQLTGMALTAGTVWWAVRASGLLASLAMGLPAWRHVDLLAVLPDDDDDDNWSGDQDDESARDERAVDRVFAAGMPNESEA